LAHIAATPYEEILFFPAKIKYRATPHTTRNTYDHIAPISGGPPLQRLRVHSPGGHRVNQSLTGGGGFAPAPRMQPTPGQRKGYTSNSLPPINTLDHWIHILHTNTRDEFAELTKLYEDDTCPPCIGVSSAALLRPSKIQHNIYGSWQKERKKSLTKRVF
jgi:hypothetical protein